MNEDFANRDWRERERDRDRERDGPGPGQAMVRDGAGASQGKRGQQQNQTPITAFYNYADAYFKTLTEDDLAWLSSKVRVQNPYRQEERDR